MIYAFKKQGESNERLMSRFKKIVQRSRIIMTKKRGKFHQKDGTKRFIRQAAVMRAAHRKRREQAKYYS